MKTPISALAVYALCATLGVSCGAMIEDPAPNEQPDRQPPAVQIASPVADETLVEIFTVSGTASDNRSVASIAVRIDSGPFQLASGTLSWSFALDTKALSNGSHTLTAQATDGAGLTATTSVVIGVQNATPLPPGPDGGLVVSSPLSLSPPSIIAGQ